MFCELYDNGLKINDLLERNMRICLAVLMLKCVNKNNSGSV